MSNHEQSFEERGFLTDPRPEQIISMMGFSAVGDLTIGIKIITTDHAGLKIIPTAHIVIALDGKEFDCPPSMLLGMIPRIQEMCDAAQRLNTHSPRVPRT